MSWKVIANGPVTATPAFVNEGQDIVFASQSGAVYNATALQRMLNWSFKTGDPITGDIHVDQDNIYVASTDRSLYRVDTGSGVQRWRLRFQDPLREGPAVVAGTVYQYSQREGLAAVDAEKGNVLWKNPSARMLLCRDDGRTYAKSPGTEILLLDSATGDVLQSVSMQRGVVPVRNTIGSSLFLVSAQGTVLCGRPEGSAHLTPSQVAEARRTLHAQPTTAPADGPLPSPPQSTLEESVIDPKDPLRSRNRTPALGSGR
jgi:outer membrane protein assembly factor BamB